MALYVSHDPRRYVLAAMTLALVGIVPLTFGFIILMPFAPGSSPTIGSVVLWALLGVAIVGVFVATMVFFARCTRLEEQEGHSL